MNWPITFLPSRKTSALPDYGRRYLDHLLAGYRTLYVTIAKAEDISEKSLSSPNEITWGDIFQLETIILAQLSPEQLVRCAWSIRARFREVGGTAAYDRYSASGIPTEADTPGKLELL